MDVQASLRALYYAPNPTLVLDGEGRIKMMNRSMRVSLHVDPFVCVVDQHFDQYLAPISQAHFASSLSESAGATDSTSHTSITVILEMGDGQGFFHAQLLIAVWYMNDRLPDEVPGLAKDIASPSLQQHFGNGARSGSPYLNGHATPSSPSSSEALFTITIASSEPWSAHTTDINKLLGPVLQDLEIATMALTKDGKSIYRNKACDKVLANLGVRNLEDNKFESDGDPNSPYRSGYGSADVFFPWVHAYIDVYDDKFEKPVSAADWPIYKCSILGETSSKTLGCISKENGRRILIELTGKPLRSVEDGTELVGGLLTLRDVTAEREQVKADIENKGERYFRQTCDALPQLVWVASETGYVEWFSQSWYDYTGTDKADSQGSGWQAIIHAEDLPEAVRRWTHAVQNGERYEVAYRCKRHDGAYRWHLGRALLFKSESSDEPLRWFGTCTDIHDQIDALGKIRRAQSHLQAVINHAAITLWAVDTEGRLTVAEGPCLEQLQLTSHAAQEGRMSPDTVGQSLYDVCGLDVICKSVEKAMHGESVMEEVDIDGRSYSMSYTPLRSETQAPEDLHVSEDYPDRHRGRINGVVGAAIDITDRKLAQKQVEESLLEKTRAQVAESVAKDASRLKSEFLANTSHEIRTPIAGVIGICELLLDEVDLSEKARKLGQTIQQCAEGLLTVINDILDFSKIETGTLEIATVPFDATSLINATWELLRFTADKKDLGMQLTMPLSEELRLMGDPGRLRQIMLNLVGNSIKFTEQGSISLAVSLLSEDASQVILRFDVQDTGCGISKASLGKLFQPFSQVDNSMTRRHNGTGLGLSICKTLVELMGGQIGLDSSEGVGSHAWFDLPLKRAPLLTPGVEVHEDRMSIDLVQKPSIEQLRPTIRRKTTHEANIPVIESGRARSDIWILVVEDNAINAQITCLNIQKLGFNCRVAENGFLALEELERNSYDLILMDCQMPLCDGYEATRLIRKSTNLASRALPIIALTASAIKGDRKKALEAGMVDHLAKPVKRMALQDALCKWLYDGETREVLTRYLP